MAYKHVIRAKTKNLLNITPSMCKQCIYKDGILKANVVNFYYAVLHVTDLFEIGNTYTVSWSIIHKKSYQTAGVVVYGKSKTDPDKTVFREYRSAITGNNYTFTINDEDFSSISFVELRFFRYGTITTDTESSILNIQVELGSTATPYTPYNYLQSNKRMIKVSNVCQLLDKSKCPASNNIAGVTYTNNGDGTWTVNGTSTHPAWSDNLIPDSKSYNLFGHKLLLMVACDDDNIVMEFKYVRKDGTGYGFNYYKENIYTLTEIENYDSFQVRLITLKTGVTFTNTQAIPQLFDLTEMFGAGHEPTTVAEFRQRFPNEYYPYSPQCWLTSYKSAVVCKTKNLFDINKLTAYTPETLPKGTAGVYNGVIISKGKPDDTTCSTGKTLRQLCPDLIVGETYTLNFETTVPSSVGGQYESIHLRGSGNWWRRNRKIITESDLSAVVYIYAETDGAVYMTYNLQVEQGSTATSYVPYQHL